MLRRCLFNFHSTHRRCSNLHAIHALFFLNNLPNLIVFRTRQHNHRTTIWSVPAMLSVFVLERDAPPTAQSTAVSRKRLVHRHRLDAREVAHAGMRAALLGFLSGFAEEAVFIRVLAAVLGDAAAVERTE